MITAGWGWGAVLPKGNKAPRERITTQPRTGLTVKRGPGGGWMERVGVLRRREERNIEIRIF